MRLLHSDLWFFNESLISFRLYDCNAKYLCAYTVDTFMSCMQHIPYYIIYIYIYTHIHMYVYTGKHNYILPQTFPQWPVPQRSPFNLRWVEWILLVIKGFLSVLTNTLIGKLRTAAEMTMYLIARIVVNCCNAILQMISFIYIPVLILGCIMTLLALLRFFDQNTHTYIYIKCSI